MPNYTIEPPSGDASSKYTIEPPSDKPSTSLSGLMGSVTRGLAPVATGAGVGAALGAPIAGVGAVPGAVAGGAAVGLTQLAGALYRPLAEKFGWPEMATPQEMTDRVLDVFGVKKPSTPLERMTEATAGGVAGGLAPARAAADLAGSLTSPVAKGVATRLAEKPALQALSGGTGGLAGQGAAEAGVDPLGQQIAQIAGGALPYAGGMKPQEFVSPAGREAAVRAKARAMVYNSLAKGVSTGETSVPDLISQFEGARAEEQPLTVLDVGGKPIEKLAGTVHRSQGGAGGIMERFYKDRDQKILDDTLDTAAGARISGLVNRYLATGSARQTAKALAVVRSENARPLWEKAMAGGSIAPLESEFEGAFNEASKAEAAATKKLQQAEQSLTLAKGKQTQTRGNVYATSAANREHRQATARVIEAHQEQLQARQAKAAVEERLRQAQSDRTLDAKGAVWSPRLQEYLDKPVFKEGLKRGMAIEDLAATNEGRKFNPYEYAIVGTEPDGSPKVGAVPNMKLLQMAKEGVDALLFEDNRFRDPITGHLTKMGRELNSARAQVVSEADRLNPDWKPAREQWAGDTANLRALNDGKKFLDPSWTAEDVKNRFDEMGESEKENARIGLADHIRTLIENKQRSADETKTFLNTTAQFKKLRVMFRNKADFDKFVAANEREKSMYEVPRRVMRGSQTAERAGDDAAQHLRTAIGIAHMLHGNLAPGALHIGSLWRQLTNPALNEELARVITDPNIGGLFRPPTTGDQGIAPLTFSIPPQPGIPP